jgi:hypothetical protein
MNRAVSLNDLSQAKERVVIGELDIALQKDLIGELILEGLVDKAKAADDILHTLEDAQALNVTQLESLEKEVAGVNAA